MIKKLASQIGRQDEMPNIELAEELSQQDNISGICEIVRGLYGDDMAIASDCIKVLYEIGKRRPPLIAEFVGDFIEVLHSKNNRLVWGSMIALTTITELMPDAVFENLDQIVLAYQLGSVITVDNSMSVFARLCLARDHYAQTVLPIIMQHLRTCMPKFVAQHTERVSICFSSDNAGMFIEVLDQRLGDLTLAQQKRVEKLLKQLRFLAST